MQYAEQTTTKREPSLPTLEELIATVSELAADEHEAAAVIDHLFASGRVRLAALEHESMAARIWH